MPSPNFYAYVHARPGATTVRDVFYVGKGKGRRDVDFTHRTAHHKHLVRKHGQANILIGRLECSSEGEAICLEQGLIRCLRKAGVALINYTDGGEGLSGHRHTEATKAKMRAARLGYVMPEEIREKVRQARQEQGNPWLGRTHSEATRRKLSEYRKGRPNPSARRPCPEDVRLRISATKQAKPLVKCPTCDVVGRAGGAMTRYHFDNCKRKEAGDAALY